MGFSSRNNAAMAIITSATMYGLITIDEHRTMVLTPQGQQVLEPNPSMSVLSSAAFRPELFDWINCQLNNDISVSRPVVLEKIKQYKLTPYNTEHSTTSYYNTIGYLCQNQHRQKHNLLLKNQKDVLDFQVGTKECGAVLDGNSHS